MLPTKPKEIHDGLSNFDSYYRRRPFRCRRGSSDRSPQKQDRLIQTMNEVSIFNQSKATVVGTRIVVADSFLTRLIGLMGRHSLEPGNGLLIAPSSGVHTCWMRIRIDVVAIDCNYRVVKLGHSVGPWRFSCVSLKTKRVLELPAGCIRSCNTEVGDQLELKCNRYS